MFASKIVYEDKNGQEVEQLLKDEAQIKPHIIELDGQKRSLVTIYGGEGHLAIGGDSRSGLIVYATKNNEAFHQLVNGTNNDEAEVTVVAGGQPGNYPARYIVSVEYAIEAAQNFANKGGLAKNLKWKKI